MLYALKIVINVAERVYSRKMYMHEFGVCEPSIEVAILRGSVVLSAVLTARPIPGNVLILILPVLLFLVHFRSE